MSIYEKTLTSRYYYISKTNWYIPAWSVILYISFFHIINVFSICLQFGFEVESMGEVIFMSSFIGLLSLFIWIHYKFFLKRESFSEKMKNLDSKSLRTYDFIHIIYELVTFGLLFIVLDIYWGNYFYVCLGLIGFHLIHRVIVLEMDESS